MLRWLFVPTVAIVGALILHACSDPSTTGPDGGTTGGGAGIGGCPSGPQPLFTLKITAADGPVPPDTTVHVTWSAADEPVFDLDDPSTYKTLEDETNVVCDVKGPKPPAELAELVCHLWTSGPTEIEIEAEGYLPIAQTLQPVEIETCDTPVPSDVPLVLVVDRDAGMQ